MGGGESMSTQHIFPQLAYQTAVNAGEVKDKKGEDGLWYSVIRNINIQVHLIRNIKNEIFSVEHVLHDLRFSVDLVLAISKRHNYVIDESRLLGPAFRVLPLIQHFLGNQALLNHFQKPHVLVPVPAVTARLLWGLALVLCMKQERSSNGE